MKGKTVGIIVALVVVLGGSALAYSLLGGDSAGTGLVDLRGGDDDEKKVPEASVVEEAGELEQTAQPEEDVDYAAPSFAMYDGDGNMVTLDELKGVPIVLNFWASWCPPCKQEMPHFDETYLEYGDQVRFVMVDLVDGMQETQESGMRHIEEQGYSFPVYFDLDRDAAYTYRVSSIPATYFIDANGDLVTGAVGMIDKDTLLRGIELIIGE